MKYAAIENGVVVNTVEIEPDLVVNGEWAGLELLPALEHTAVGDALIDGALPPLSPPSKERLIEQTIAEINAERDKTLGDLVVDYNGARYDGDERSQLRITGAVTLLSLAPAGTTQQWIDADNITRELNARDLASIGALIAAKVTQITIEYRAKKDAAIEAIEGEYENK
jgi:hypothetical protein